MSAPTPPPSHGQPYPSQPPQGHGQQAPYPVPPAGPHPGGEPYPPGYPAQGAHPGGPTPPRKSWFARHKILTGLGVVVLLAIIGSALGGGGGDETTPSSTPPAASEAPAEDAPSDPEGEAADPEAPAEDTPAEEPAPEEPAAPGIGTPVRDGDFEFTVTSVETGVASVGDEFLSQEAQGQYVLVHMTVTNIGTEAQMFDGSSQELTDTEGRTHSADTSAAIYLGDANSFLTDINPGNSVEGTVVFDLPADAVPATIDLHDSMFSGGVEVALS